MKDDQYLTTSELANILSLPRTTVDRWRKPQPVYRWVRDPVSRRKVQVAIPQPPVIPWEKVDGRVLYDTVEVEAYLKNSTANRAAERLVRFEELKASRRESGSVTLEHLFRDTD